MKSRRFLSIIAAAGMVWAAPLRAEDPSPADLAAMDDAQLAKAIADLSAKKDQSNDNACEMSLYLGERSRRQKTEATDGQAALLSGLCAQSQGRWTDVLVQFSKAEQICGDKAPPEQRIAFDNVIMTAAAVTKDKTAFETHLMHVAARGWPDEFSAAEPRLWFFGLNLMSSTAREHAAFILSRSAAFANLPGELHDELASYAIHPAIVAGDLQLAFRLARDTASPGKLLNMLIDREYEPLWPQLEDLAGPHMDKALTTNLQKQRERMNKNPDDKDARSELVKALVGKGDFAGAVEAAAKIDHSSMAEDSWTESDGWVLNMEVKALDRLGRRAEGDALFDRLGTLKPDEGRGWIVSFTINRADRLVGQGRWKEALPATELAVAVAAENGSPYAKESAASDRLCVVTHLEPKRAELAPWWSDIAEHWKDNVGGAIVAAMCKGDRAKARKLAVLGLADPELRNTTLLALQPPGSGLYRDMDSANFDPSELLSGDPELLRMMEKYGRILPAALMPN